MPTTPYEDLIESNDKYHKAIDRILREGNDFIEDVRVRVAVKAAIGAIAAKVFGLMAEIKSEVTKYYVN